jgi:NAD(P)-dependent dehydrogenase (short-subunit alcohol dehydrogenase family)
MTPISTGFTAQSSAADVIAGIDLDGKRAVVTGASSGIGVETARAIASAGGWVTLAVRDLEAGRRTATDIVATTGNAHVDFQPLDLADLSSVRAFVAGWDGPLHILINNAGVMACPFMRTPAGCELQFATNHIGHFALSTGLHAALSAAQGARIVAVSSVAHQRSPVVFDDIHFRERSYDPWLAYGQSKTANVLFAVEANRRWAADSITVNALHPGGILTNLQRHLPKGPPPLTTPGIESNATASPRKSIEQGAATSVLLATSPLLEGIGGTYFEDCNEALPQVPGTRSGIAPHATDPEAAARLWQVSTDMVAAGA